MRVLWAPWRLSYVERTEKNQSCIFCDKPALTGPAERREALVLHSDPHSSVIINKFPYTNGNLMVSPRTHTADLPGLDAVGSTALLETVKLAVSALDEVYSPQGFNIGMNLGRSAGAGIDEHLHWHVVPRWEGDTNFMPLLAETRVIPEHLEDCYDRLLPVFERASKSSQ